MADRTQQGVNPVTGDGPGEGERASASPRKRLHRATYTRDKKKGGYLVRVAGPTAGSFAGREVPVTTARGSENIEKLTALLWTGADTGEYGGTPGEPIALYTFEAKPRDGVEEVEF